MEKFTTDMLDSQASPGLELKLAHIRQGLHLYEVARLVGITPARLSQFEGGHRTPPPELEDKLRAVLGLQPDRSNDDGQAQG